MILYHGSTEGGMTVLDPVSRDREGNPALYVTDNYAYGLFYLRDRRTDFVTCGVAGDGKVHYDEWFPDQMKTLYEGRSGWIYEIEAEAQPQRTRGIYIIRAQTAVTGQHHIADAYAAILEEIQKGRVVVRTYEEATAEQLQQYRDGMIRWLRSVENLSAEKAAFYQTYFPACWREAKERRWGRGMRMQRWMP